MLEIDILTLFPRMVEVPLQESIIGKAREKGLIRIGVHDIRAHAKDKHHTVDDVPYGGGPGMVMKPDPLVEAIEAARVRLPGARVLLLSPRGTPFTQAVARELLAVQKVILVCGRYEGVDERVLDFVDGEISVGDYVLSGGELGALVIADAVCRLAPGVLGNVASPCAESFEDGLLEYPQYTRPPEFRGRGVPSVLLSGDHGRIARWRRQQSLKITRSKRPDLIAKSQLSEEDRALLKSLD